MVQTDAKRAWIESVLGYRFPDSPRRPAPLSIQQALADFDAAQAEVDRQIGQLQLKLQNSPDAELRRIGQFGMNALTGNTRVKLQAAILELRASLPQGSPKLAGNAGRLAGQMADYLVHDVKVRACDRNPFKVQVSIAATLGGAAGRLCAALQQAA